MTRPGKITTESNPGSAAREASDLTTGPTRRLLNWNIKCIIHTLTVKRFAPFKIVLIKGLNITQLRFLKKEINTDEWGGGGGGGCWLLNVPATCECISGTNLHNFTCCHTEIEVADQIFHLTQ